MGVRETERRKEGEKKGREIELERMDDNRYVAGNN